MKLRKREFDIFNLSFLDVISCGFGAVVMLVLISKTHDDVSITGQEEIKDLLKTVITLENTILDIKQTIESQFSKADQLSNENEQLETASTQLERKIQQQEEKQASLAGDLQGLALVQSTGARSFEPQIYVERARLWALRGDASLARQNLRESQ